ncbi:MAG: alpha/beta hydrolase fold domain-containing protein [Flavobacteriaceae bacterium]|nr:alpha/beta hydrolase fold domain-containing protein [Flavobacteriaceae bacterium]
MKKLISLPLIFLFLACAKSDSPETIVDLESILGVAQSDSPLGEGLFFEDINYGDGERQQLDILFPEETSPKGVVLFFHGGGFTGGDKEQAFDELLLETMQAVLDENIAIVSANYTLLTTPGNQGVISALEDGMLVIDFIQDRLADLNIPTNKIVLAGTSAGAGIAQWNGFKNEINTQVQGVLAIAAQSTYDLYEWENVFPGFSLDNLRQMSPFLQTLFLGFYGGEPTQADLDAVDYRDFMDTTDPALYVYNFAGDELINAQGEIDFDVLYHSFRHSDYLRSKAIELEQEFSGIFQESPEAFVIRVLD